MQKDGVKFESFWTRRSALLAVVIGVLVFTVNLLQDVFLQMQGFSRWSVVVLSDIITGAIAGALFYQFAKNERTRRELIRERMHTIAELNHHIRNALQVIKFWGAQHQNCVLDEMQIGLMKDSVERIEWALREVLPKYPIPAGTTITEGQPQITRLSADASKPWQDSRTTAAEPEKSKPH